MNKEIKALTFKLGETEIKVAIEDNTGWLSAKEMMTLFNVSQSTISRCIKATYNDIDIDMKLSTRYLFKNEYLMKINKRNVRVKVFNLDVVLTVGRMLKSNNGQALKIFVEKELTAITYSENTEIITYCNGSLSIDVKVSPDRENVWLSQGQIATLFNTTQPNISIHISNILSERELDDSVHKDFLYTGSDGKKYSVTFYNLDLILAVGYRVKGERAIQFRKWASSILKQYLLKGYAINNDRVLTLQENILRLENDVAYIKQESELREKERRYAIFDKGQYYDAYEYVCKLIDQAERSITIIDPYFDDKALTYLKKVKKSVIKRVCLSRKDLLSDDAIKKFRSQYGPVNFYLMKKLHDRFIVVDENKCYLIGTSLNHMGSKLFAVNQIESPGIINVLLTRVDHAKLI